MNYRPFIVLGLCTAACGAPKAAPISGDIQAVIQRAVQDGTDAFDHTAWNDLLASYAVDGGRRFDYAGLKKEEQRFERYIESIAGVDLAVLSRAELEALLINAYNAYTVRTILSRVAPDGTYQIGSIRDIDDVFGREQHVVGGFRLSLDNIEHNILRPTFKDPRIHFAVNCASISCPPLPVTAFTGEGIDAQLETATRSALANPDYVSIEGDALLLTKIFDWYGTDFTNPDFEGSESTLPAFVRKYVDEELRQWIDGRGADLAVKFRDYDWRLNRPERN